ncbi:MAG: N-acetylmuramoyl-L-alanine amidase [Sporomusaceae bacterium]|nr:N-acetylmuramoyl-L-alanine amidase [Sporomusaceae bacterium]
MRVKPGPTALLLILLILLCSLPAAAQPGSLTGKTVVLDPGHGGNQAGAFHHGVREADVNLAIGLELKARLTAAGATVVMTRATDDLSASPGITPVAELQARVDIARNAAADIFVSLHANAHPTKPETAGAITFYAPGRPNDLAATVLEALVLETGAVNKGVRPANFYVLRTSDIPAVLVEVGFLTNRDEAARLADSVYQQEIAAGICKGIMRYFLAR